MLSLVEIEVGAGIEEDLQLSLPGDVAGLPEEALRLEIFLARQKVEELRDLSDAFLRQRMAKNSTYCGRETQQ